MGCLSSKSDTTEDNTERTSAASVKTTSGDKDNIILIGSDALSNVTQNKERSILSNVSRDAERSMFTSPKSRAAAEAKAAEIRAAEIKALELEAAKAAAAAREAEDFKIAQEAAMRAAAMLAKPKPKNVGNIFAVQKKSKDAASQASGKSGQSTGAPGKSGSSAGTTNSKTNDLSKTAKPIQVVATSQPKPQQNQKNATAPAPSKGLKPPNFGAFLSPKPK